MKTSCILGMLVLNLFCFGQSSVHPFSLSITCDKTTTLIFPYAIRQVDRGIASVLVQKSTGLENVLQVKAAARNFPETNLTVITADGKLYPFTIRYSPDPPELNFSFSDGTLGEPVLFGAQRLNASQMDSAAGLVSGQKHFLHRASRAPGMVLRLEGIYLKDQFTWFLLRIRNKSLTDYTLENIHCSARYKKRPKRTAMQEIDKKPSYQPSMLTVPGQTDREILLGFAGFFLIGNQQMRIELREHDGARILTLPVASGMLLRARTIH